MEFFARSSETRFAVAYAIRWQGAPGENDDEKKRRASRAQKQLQTIFGQLGYSHQGSIWISPVGAEGTLIPILTNSIVRVAGLVECIGSMSAIKLSETPLDVVAIVHRMNDPAAKLDGIQWEK